MTIPPLDRPHRNHGLFSDHYLDNTLPRDPRWKELLEDARAMMDQIRNIFEDYTPATNEKEAQTEKYWVQPVLEALGHDAFEVQPSLRVPGAPQEPDYVFYYERAARNSHKGNILDEESLLGSAYAVGDAKRWDRPLDVPLEEGDDPFDNRNPSWQIFFYMLHSGLEWGLLTNGRLWRLYHKDTAKRLDRYYEVDLPALLETGDPDAFLYFYAFFRRSAFDHHPPLGLVAFLQESASYARDVGEALRKTQVYEALRHLAQGFLDYPGNGLSPDPETVRDLHDNSLIVLYRLLFVLYSEARELLPVRESEMYRRSYSLYAVKHEVAQGHKLLPTSVTLWPRLKELFHIIDQGSPPLGVATFDGGLFDPERHPFLERNAVADARLQKAIDLLSRVGGDFVDYRDLAERHLGTIYEGLLEFELEPLEEPEEGWTVGFNDRGGRKATGSYYTPGYIVEYIVEETIGPLLREAVAGKETGEKKIDAVLALNVLDPSMGSGHFLVEVTERIARFLVELNVAPDEVKSNGEAELIYWKRRVAQSCVYGVDFNPLAVELAKLSLWLVTVAKDRPLSFLDHHLRTGNSLVGAHILDLQPAETHKRGRKKVQDDTGQLSMTSDPAFRNSIITAVGSMWEIEERPADTVEDVKEQERIYEALRDNLTRRYARLADLATATHFGVKVDRTHWRALADYAAGRIAYVPPQFERWLDEAEKIANELRFFHWELEFPEVFFDRQGRPEGDDAGFDAVIGNPPYVRREALKALKPYLKQEYRETYDSNADLYVYFYHQGLRQLKRGAPISYIVTNKWLRTGYGEPLRSYFSTEGVLEELIDFGHAPIFPGTDVFPCISTVYKGEPNDGRWGNNVRVTEFPREALGKVELRPYIEEHGHIVPRRHFRNYPWTIGPPAIYELMEKIRTLGTPLPEFAGMKPYRGILTGLNEAFLIDTPTKERLVRKNPRSAEIIKPYVRGQDIKRWSPDWQDLWMIVLKSSENHHWPWSDNQVEAEKIFKREFPSVYDHMKPLEGKLRNRQDKGRYWWELRSCTYYDAFETPAIVHTDIAWRPEFAVTHSPTFLVNTAYLWPTTDPWLQAVMNSPLLWAYMWRTATHGKDEALRIINSYIETIPVVPPPEGTQAEIESAVQCLTQISRDEHERRRELLDWLLIEFGVEKPGEKLENFALLDSDTFVEEVRKRRPRSKGRLSPTALKDLRAGYSDMATPVREDRIEAAQLEWRLSDFVNRAYSLTQDEVNLLWSTAPPRMPTF